MEEREERIREYMKEIYELLDNIDKVRLHHGLPGLDGDIEYE